MPFILDLAIKTRNTQLGGDQLKRYRVSHDYTLTMFIQESKFTRTLASLSISISVVAYLFGLSWYVWMEYRLLFPSGQKPDQEVSIRTGHKHCNMNDVIFHKKTRDLIPELTVEFFVWIVPIDLKKNFVCACGTYTHARFQSKRFENEGFSRFS